MLSVTNVHQFGNISHPYLNFYSSYINHKYVLKEFYNLFEFRRWIIDPPVTCKNAELLSLPPLEMTWHLYHPMSTLKTPVIVSVPSTELTVWRGEFVTSTVEGGSDWVRYQCHLTSTFGSLETPHCREAEEPFMMEVLVGGWVIIVFTAKEEKETVSKYCYWLTSIKHL